MWKSRVANVEMVYYNSFPFGRKRNKNFNGKQLPTTIKLLNVVEHYLAAPKICSPPSALSILNLALSKGLQTFGNHCSKLSTVIPGERTLPFSVSTRLDQKRWPTIVPGQRQNSGWSECFYRCAEHKCTFRKPRCNLCL